MAEEATKTEKEIMNANEQFIEKFTNKIIEIIKENFEMNYKEIILESDIDEELKDFDVFFASIKYDLKKLINF